MISISALASDGTASGMSELNIGPANAERVGRKTGSRLARSTSRGLSSRATRKAPWLIFSPIAPAPLTTTSPAMRACGTGSSLADRVRISTRDSSGNRKVRRP